MRRSGILGIFILALLSSGAVSQEATPDFSGLWRMNSQKSHTSGQPPEDERMKIEHVGPELSMILLVRSKGVDDLMQFLYHIGSDENQNELHGGSMKSSARWQGNTLKIDSVVMYGHDPLNLNDLWSLSADGQTLTLKTRHQFKDEPAGEETYVYDKQPAGSWEPPQGPRTAEMVYKNIQVLKGIPASHLPSTMLFFTKSLGVECTHCHVANEFPKDEKPAKAIARQMLKMVQQINESTFAGKQSVSCWTCHRGNVKPELSPG